MSHVVVVIGAGSIGQAIARRVSAGKQIVLADLGRQNADAAAEVRDAESSKKSEAIARGGAGSGRHLPPKSVARTESSPYSQSFLRPEPRLNTG